MAIDNRQLFLDRFIEYNVERYKDKPLLVAMFQALTLADIHIYNYQTQQIGDKEYHFYDVDKTDTFMGVNQRFLGADPTTGRIFTVIEEVDDENEMSLRTVEGAYQLQGTEAVQLLVERGKEKDRDHVVNLVIKSSKYAIEPADISYTVGDETIVIKNETIDGSLTIVVSLFDSIPRYNGQFRLNGAARAL